MSSMKVFNKLTNLYPEGVVIDGGGNCFLVAVEFPAKDGSNACVQLWEEGVLFYHRNGKVISKEMWQAILESEEEDEHFVNNAYAIFDDDNVFYEEDYDDVDNVTMTMDVEENDFFSKGTMVEIGKAWLTFKDNLDKAFNA